MLVFINKYESEIQDFFKMLNESMSWLSLILSPLCHIFELISLSFIIEIDEYTSFLEYSFENDILH